MDALFSYRNKMLHGGFEWDDHDIEEFKANMKNNGWPERWFSASYKSEKVWIYYMTHEFIDYCFVIIEKILNGIGAYVKRHIVSA